MSNCPTDTIAMPCEKCISSVDCQSLNAYKCHGFAPAQPTNFFLEPIVVDLDFLPSWEDNIY
jgi:hypothetical protein